MISFVTRTKSRLSEWTTLDFLLGSSFVWINLEDVRENVLAEFVYYILNNPLQ